MRFLQTVVKATTFKCFFILFNFYAFIFLAVCGISYSNERYKDLKDFEEVLEIIHKQYIDKVENKELIENAIKGMLSSLDPYSTFLNKEEYAEMKSSTKGEFVGIGVEIKMEQGFLKVVSSYKTLPAYKAGIKPGDIIVMINDESVSGMGVNQVVDKLKGELGSKVKVKIYREPGEIKELTIVREVIKLTPTKVLFYNQDKVIYARVANFSERTSTILKNELQKIISSRNDIKGLVLDIRDNPGGVLDQAVKVSRLFLPKGNIVSLKTKYDSNEMSYEANGFDITKGIPMVVLINNGSASASEIVAGALQDNKRALIIGEKSFCKGLVQNIIPFTNGSAIKLTTAKFYTPSGRSIQEDCIIPDIEVKHTSNMLDSENANNNIKEFVNKNNHASDLIQDYPLQRAIDLVKGIALYKNN